ncbi:MAG: DUF1501 domain-containing protein [Gemmataceae bacterium]
MTPTRRDFLKGSSLAAFGLSVPTFLAKTALAAPQAGTPGAKDTVLVVVQLTGGNDGLNTVIPFDDPDYKKLRPTIAIDKAQVLKLNDKVGLHPAMDGLAKLHESSSLCVVQGVGYPNPDQSHFRSMDIWQGGTTDKTINEGWLGKALKLAPSPSFHLSGSNETSPLALAGAPVRVPSVTSLEDFQLKFAAISGQDKQQQRAVIEGSAAPASKAESPSQLLDFVQRTAVNTYASSKRLAELSKAYEPKVPYPQTALATRLKLAAQLINADLGARVFYVSIDGFDTHAGQGGPAGPHANLLRDVSGAIAAFTQDVAARGQGNRVCTMTFSEFGRRAKENGSRGTDHGSGAPMILAGGKVKAGVVGDHPSLSKLESGNLKHAIDFRRVYAAILDKWLGVDSAAVLGQRYEAVEVFKG